MSKHIAKELIDALYAGASVPPGCRINHARGLLVEGYFRATPAASKISTASIFNGLDHALLVRFSSSGADPGLAQDHAQAEPRGLALKIGEQEPLVLVGHSIEGFPARDPETFLAFLKALKNAGEQPEGMNTHLKANPAAQRFGAMRQDPRPSSFTALDYHMLHPYRLTSSDSASQIGRLIVARHHSDCAQTPDSGPDYLDESLQHQMASKPVEIALVFTPVPAEVQADDLTATWPDKNDSIVLGHLFLQRTASDQPSQRSLVFDPSILPSGMAFAGDPMIEARVQAYRIAAARRCGAPIKD